MGVSNPDSPSIRSLVERLRVQTGDVHRYRLIEVLQDLDCCFFSTLLQPEVKTFWDIRTKLLILAAIFLKNHCIIINKKKSYMAFCATIEPVNHLGLWPFRDAWVAVDFLGPALVRSVGISSNELVHPYRVNKVTQILVVKVAWQEAWHVNLRLRKQENFSRNFLRNTNLPSLSSLAHIYIKVLRWHNPPSPWWSRPVLVECWSSLGEVRLLDRYWIRSPSVQSHQNPMDLWLGVKNT